MEIKRNQYYFDQLPLHIQQQIAINIKSEMGSNALEDYLKRTERSMIGFLGGVFTWTHSKEGSRYWADLQEAYADATRKNITIDLESFYKKYPQYSTRDEIVNNYSIY